MNYKHYPIHILSHKRPTKTTLKTNSYKDRVDCDLSNRTFYIYDLGRFNNTHIYHYGETLDIDLIDFSLRKTLPFYKRITYIPMEHHVHGKNKFTQYISSNDLTTTIPIIGLQNLEAFTTSDKYTISVISDEINSIFKFIQV